MFARLGRFRGGTRAATNGTASHAGIRLGGAGSSGSRHEPESAVASAGAAVDFRSSPATGGGLGNRELNC
jgi:hypothetical protein